MMPLILGGLYTWLDVKAILESDEELGRIARADVYYDTAEFHIENEYSRERAQMILRSLFGDRFTGDAIRLEPFGQTTREIRVAFQVEERERPVYKPQFENSQIPLFSFQESTKVPPPFPPGAPTIFAFHSYKGGVGRTTHLLAMLMLASRTSNSKALIVDSDLEAPGITWLAEADRYNAPVISFLDALALWQTDSSMDRSRATAFLAERVGKQSIVISTRSCEASHYYLPTFRYANQLLTHSIRPENIVQSPDDGWRYANLLCDLGKALGVKAVFVDLRAGMSEASAPLLLDPRVTRIIVSNLSEQSLRGTTEILDIMRRDNRALSSEALPQLIVTFSTPELQSTNLVASAEERLLSHLGLTDDNGTLDAADVAETPFSTPLQVVHSLSDAFEKIENSGLLPSLEPYWGRLSPDHEDNPTTESEDSNDSIRSKRRALSEEAEKYEYAESGGGDDFLSTPQLRALASRYNDVLPSAVVIGAKGSGKTYTYLQIARRKTWRDFVNSATPQESASGCIQGHVWPLLEPKNLSSAARGITASCAGSLIKRYDLSVPASTRYKASEKIMYALTSERNDLAWRDLWFEVIAQSLGVEIPQGLDPAAELVQFLRTRKMAVVTIIDGLEDIFTTINSDERQRTAVRALLQDVILRLQQFEDCPLGILVFVRGDISRAAVMNNYGQFRRLYEGFELKWDREQALRLVYWLAVLSKIFVAQRAPEAMTEDELREELAFLWGRKLGPDESREARTTDWVIAALSDFQGRIQARDLVRFLHFSAQGSVPSPTYRERILVPSAIRAALKHCSDKKIDEIEEENPALKDLFDKLRRADQQKIPLDPVAFGLTRNDILLLQETGVLLEESGLYYMPEIFRQGLDFTLEAGARPKVLTLAKRALRYARI